ncbi:hypothetical protein EJB05_47713, partial [Eragrostis curvula]
MPDTEAEGCSPVVPADRQRMCSMLPLLVQHHWHVLANHSNSRDKHPAKCQNCFMHTICPNLSHKYSAAQLAILLKALTKHARTAYKLRMLSKNTLHCTRRLNSSSSPSSRCWMVSPSALSSRRASPSCKSFDDKELITTASPASSSHATRALFRNALATHVDHPPRGRPLRTRRRGGGHPLGQRHHDALQHCRGEPPRLLQRVPAVRRRRRILAAQPPGVGARLPRDPGVRARGAGGGRGVTAPRGGLHVDRAGSHGAERVPRRGARVEQRHGRAQLVLDLLGARRPGERLRVLVHARHAVQGSGHRRRRRR